MSVAHYENFPVASFLVPARLRPAVVALYAFARAADDAADEGDLAPDERLAELARFDAALDAIAAGREPGPLFAELARVVRRHGLPVPLLADLVSAFRQDVTVHRHPTFEAVLDYARRSANPVGRLLLHLYDAVTPERLAWSDAICTALQLANFWQDVAGDWQRGRIYLPGEDLVRFGVGEETLAHGQPTAAFRALMRFETARTRAMLESGRPLTRALPWRLGLELSGVLAGGHWVLDAIDAVDGDVFHRRPSLARGDWLRVAWHAIVPPRRHRGAWTGAGA